ncbi:hypothetical protein [Streptomyces sp. NPDC048309]|uniref:hypothetical protein n=1 Tax=Streptomyces sp. NPDC048309 TaxID=3154618 RepID=UPI0033F8CC54
MVRAHRTAAQTYGSRDHRVHRGCTHGPPLPGTVRRTTGATAPDRPDIPDHPAYQQILTALADAGRPIRARDLCQALDLPILPKNTEGIRSKLKRLVSRGILIEPEPGLFARPNA